MKRICERGLSSLFVMLICSAAQAVSGMEQVSKSNFKSPVKLSIYSESIYDARFDGAVTETRFRLYPTKNYLIKPYVGLVLSQDLSNGRSPLLIENMLAPAVGIQIPILKYFHLFAENRYPYRFKNELRSDSENELRYGGFAYYFTSLGATDFFNETYAELVTVDRVVDRPVAVAWNKLGKRYQFSSGFRADFYFEGFTRISPDLGYGPDENELRLGLRSTYVHGYWAASFVVNHALLSDVKQGGTDAMLVISREVY